MQKNVVTSFNKIKEWNQCLILFTGQYVCVLDNLARGILLKIEPDQTLKDVQVGQLIFSHIRHLGNS